MVHGAAAVRAARARRTREELLDERDGEVSGIKNGSDLAVDLAIRQAVVLTEADPRTSWNGTTL